jgi:hypothetical protein
LTLPLQVALDQCRRHVVIMQGALADLPARLNASAIEQDDLVLLRTVDQFVYRFIKLLDTLGEHVLRSFASEILAEPVIDAPLIDVLTRLERYGFLETQQWARWRSLRNSLTHEYPDHPETRIAVLEEARLAADALARLVQQIEARRAQVG